MTRLKINGLHAADALRFAEVLGTAASTHAVTIILLMLRGVSNSA